ncbi:MAG: InlB B-repeat-containing protein [Oscillospiraceae bacterium]
MIDANVNVNGTLTVKGSLYTTESGADICSEGTGVYQQSGSVGTETVTYQYTQSGSAVTAHKIPITPAKLHNADGTYEETKDAVVSDVWNYEDGKWTLDAASKCTVTFDANNGSGKTSTQEVAVNVATLLKANEFVYEGFTFTGWNTKPDGTGESYTDKAEVTLAEDITLYAQWKVTTFTVTWKNGSTTLYTEEVEYGKTPEYVGDTPAKAATAQYTYTFKGWNPEPAPIKADTIYRAQFDQTVNKYTITWYDEDGTTILAVSDVEYGTIPVYPEGEPTKTGSADITYVFNGWTPALAKVTAAASYTATFRAVNNRTVIWVNWDGTELDRATVTAEQTPEYTGVTPEREGDEQYAYVFSGWEPVEEPNDSDMIYKAVFEKTERSYNVTWLDENGDVLSTDTVVYGEFPTAPEMAAEKTVTETVEVPAAEAADAETGEAEQTFTTEESSTTYYFIGWTPVLTRVTGDVSYQAVYAAEAPAETHTVTWVNYDGTELSVVSGVKAGEIVSYSGETPVKNADEHYSYTFSGWDASEDQSGNIVYTAAYTANGIPSTITWQYEDGTVLKTDSVPYGELPVYSGMVPSKAPEGDRKFVFAGWSPAVTAVTGDAAYTAIFDKVLRRYTINWVNWDDTVLGTTTVTEGETPAYTGETPIRQADIQYTYTFSGWTPAVGPAMADETYKAVFTSETVKYTVSWYDEDGTTLLGETKVPMASSRFIPERPKRPRMMISSIHSSAGIPNLQAFRVTQAIRRCSPRPQS